MLTMNGPEDVARIRDKLVSQDAHARVAVGSGDARTLIGAVIAGLDSAAPSAHAAFAELIRLLVMPPFAASPHSDLKWSLEQLNIDMDGELSALRSRWLQTKAGVARDSMRGKSVHITRPVESESR